MQESSQRGQATQWAVGAWTLGGNVPDAKIQLQSSTGAGTPTFSFGCGTGNGTSTCDLGAVDSASAQRELQAEVTVPVTATTVTAVSLTVTGTAANLAMDPAATGSVIILTPSAVGASVSSLSATLPPGVAAPITAVSPGDSAANLFPTVAPSERPVANVSALGGSPVGSKIAEAAGLAALGVAMVLAVARVSFRRPEVRHAANSTVAAVPPPEAPAERHE
jgi:hypothetical protein